MEWWSCPLCIYEVINLFACYYNLYCIVNKNVLLKFSSRIRKEEKITMVVVAEEEKIERGSDGEWMMPWCTKLWDFPLVAFPRFNDINGESGSGGSVWSVGVLAWVVVWYLLVPLHPSHHTRTTRDCIHKYIYISLVLLWSTLVFRSRRVKISCAPFVLSCDGFAREGKWLRLKCFNLVSSFSKSNERNTHSKRMHAIGTRAFFVLFFVKDGESAIASI